MTQKSFFTVGQLADRLHEPEWKVRRAVDSLDTEIPRAGQYRLVPSEMLPEIDAKLHPSHTEPSACK